MDKRPVIISVLVVLVFAWYYFFSIALHERAGMLVAGNAVIAFASAVILSLSFLIGPLARLFKWFGQFLVDRKEYGLIGYSLAALHLLLAIAIMLEPGREIVFADIGSLVFAGLAFAIFTIMAFTSTNQWVNKLGYDNWKMLQRTGYIALGAVMAHIVLLEEGVFLSRITGQIAISLILFILLIRIIVLVLGITHKEEVHAW